LIPIGAGRDTACDRYIDKNVKNYITNRIDTNIMRTVYLQVRWVPTSKAHLRCQVKGGSERSYVVQLVSRPDALGWNAQVLQGKLKPGPWK